jgi:hypothetical protein
MTISSFSLGYSALGAVVPVDVLDGAGSEEPEEQAATADVSATVKAAKPNLVILFLSIIRNPFLIHIYCIQLKA